MPTNDAAVVSKKLVFLLPAILIGVLASRAWAATAGPKRVEPERLPLGFEALGARDGTPGFVARGNGYALLLAAGGATLALVTPSSQANVGMEFVGGSGAPRLRGLDELPGKTNELIGNRPELWRRLAPSFARVRYEAVYPGVDLVFHGDGRDLEYDLLLAPAAEVDSIRLRFRGAEELTLGEDGSLRLEVAGGTLLQHAPRAYQEIGGVRHPVEVGYTLEKTGLVRFRVGRHDETKPLVIDPVLTYSTYFGGSSLDAGNVLATDREGNLYVGGVTASLNLPIEGPFQGVFGGFVDGFVAKISADGSTLLFSTYLGGTAADQVFALVVDDAGAITVAGFTGSPDFPTVHPLQSSIGGSFDGFVARLDPTGSQLLYSTYLGGSDYDSAGGLALAADGSVYVAGGTASPNFPLVHPLQPAYGGGSFDAFVARLSPAGDRLLYSTFLGGSGSDGGGRVGLDPSGVLHLVGITDSPNFPTLNAFQARFGGVDDAFIAGIKADGSGLTYASYLGGRGLEDTIHADFDRDGRTYLTGRTISPDFPVFHAYQPAYNGFRDAFVAKFDLSGGVLYSTYLGGSGLDLLTGETGNGIASDAQGRAYVVGTTNSVDFPLVDPVQGQLGGGICGFSGSTLIPCEDAFVTVLSADGSSLLFSTYLGGSGTDVGGGIAVDRRGNFFATGYTYSTDFPIVSALQPVKGGTADSYDAFLTKFTALNRAPRAAAGADATLECASPQGAVTVLDGSGSTDDDSSPGTNDDIVSFRWFEDAGLPSQTFLGSGPILEVTLPLGGHDITLRVTDAAGASAEDTLRIVVVDTMPPTLTIDVSPALLWPPNHRMVDVTATVAASDLCGAASVMLTSVSSSEPDDAAGVGDGATLGDIAGADLGTADVAFQVRAERDSRGAGRTYTVVYAATDGAGLVITATSHLFVPHDQAGVVDPLRLELEETGAGTLLHWAAVPGARSYNVIRGRLGWPPDAGTEPAGPAIECLVAGLAATSTIGSEDATVPPFGGAFTYLVEYDDGGRSGYGTESAVDDRSAPPGTVCP